jgi:cell division protein FtsB
MKAVSDLLTQSLMRCWKLAGTKYVIVLLLAGGWMLVFDRYNLRSQQQVKAQTERLEQDRRHYQQAINALDYEVDQLFSDPEELERFARERYHMKRPNEDVYVVVKAVDRLDSEPQK